MDIPPGIDAQYLESVELILKRGTRKLAVLAAVLVLVASALAFKALAHPIKVGSAAKPADSVYRAVTPPMGFNDFAYDTLGGERKLPTQELFETTADAMKADGLQAAGYRYINVDGGWQGGRNAKGGLFPDPARFPDGMKSLSTYLHQRGFKFGLYTTASVTNCNGTAFGTWGHYSQDAETFARWGADFLKADYCKHSELAAKYPTKTPDEIARIQYSSMSHALAATGRPVVLSESAPAYFNTTKNSQYFFPVMDWIGDYGSLWRIGADVSNNWRSVMHAYRQDTHPGLAKYAGPGHWNDPDMLEIGNPGLTNTEAQSQFTLWAELAAPLLISTDVPHLSPRALAILKNRDIIAVDQDRLGRQGTIAATTPNYDVVTKPLANGDRAVVLLNKGSSARNITTNAMAVGFKGGGHTYRTRDLVSKSMQTTTGPISARVPAHGTVMYRVSTLK